MKASGVNFMLLCSNFQLLFLYHLDSPEHAMGKNLGLGSCEAPDMYLLHQA